MSNKISRATKREIVVESYRKIFLSPEGEEVLKDLLNICGFRRSIIGKDSHETYFNEGQRNVVLRILETIEMPHDVLRKILDNMRKEDSELI